MQEHDLDCIALLIVGRREKSEDKTRRQCQRRGADQPGKELRARIHEALGIGEGEHAGHLGCHSMVRKHRDQPARLSRTAAAAAKGESNVAATENAARNRSAPSDSPSSIACTAAAPKMTAGASSGSTKRGRINPPLRIERVSPAPIAPSALTAGVPISNDKARVQVAATGRPNIVPSNGESTVSGKPVVSQCAAILAALTVSS